MREIVRDMRMILSHINVEQDRPDEAQQWLEQVLDEFPENIGAQNDLGYLWADRGTHLLRALAMITRAVEEEPDNMAYRDSLGWVLFRLGRNEEAAAELEKAAAVEEPDAVILDHLGDVYLKLNDASRAVEVWRKALDRFQKDEDSDNVRQTQAKIRKHRPK